MNAILLIAAAAAASPAQADDCRTNPANCIVVADPLAAPEIVVAAGVPQQEREIGQAVTRIDRATIEQRQTVSLADLLATTPGVTVSRNGGPGSLTSLRIRGAEAEQTLVIIDGVRVNDPSSPGGAFDFGSLLAGSIDHVEILRGPNAVPWGSQALGGVVNIVTEQPTTQFRARANAEYGFHESVYATGGISGGRGALTGALNAGYFSTDGISAAANGTERDGYRQFGGSGTLGIALSSNVGIDLRGYYAHGRIAQDGFPPPNYSLADTPEYATSQEIYGYAGLHADFGRTRNRLAFTIADINRDNYDPTYGSAPSFIGRGRSERYEYQGDWRLSDAVRLVAGAEHEDSRFNDGSTFASTGISSVYGEAILRPVAALTLTGGARYDDHRTFGGHTSFGANAAFALGTGTTLRASYSDGFKAPTLYQLYSYYGSRSLQPETARNVDIGVTQSVRGASFSATWFHRDTHNQIDFDLGTFRYGNIARTRAEGVELEAALHPTPRLSVTGEYSFIDAQNRSAGANFAKQLARRPRQTVSVSADWRTPLGLSLGATILHVGDSFDDAGNRVRLDGYVLASLRAELPLDPRFSLYGRIENLGQARYQTVAGYGTYPRAAYAGVRMRLN